MDRRLKLNDGTVLTDSYVLLDGNILWFYIYANVTLAEVFELLNDPSKVGKVTAEQYGGETVYEGFAELFCIRKEVGGFISAGVRKDV